MVGMKRLLYAAIHQKSMGKMTKINGESQELQKLCEEDIHKHFGTMLKSVKIRKTAFAFLCFMFVSAMIFQLTTDFRENKIPDVRFRPSKWINEKSQPLIIVITPTYKRFTRMADMTRMANTLMHIEDLYWIVIEDGSQKNKQTDELLKRSKLRYSYLPYKTEPGYPRRGWYQRTMALKFLRTNTSEILGNNTNGVVYFADDDNAYDIRLFTEYIRNVKKLGMWAVGLVGGTVVEAPHVVNGKVTGFDVKWNAKRMFAVDMAGFAVNLDVVLRTDAVFGTSCKRGAGAPETCLLQDMELTRNDIEPFGFDKEKDREIYVWHTKTASPNLGSNKKKTNSTSGPIRYETYGYIVET
ncbi:unnamed protein product [Caenorhabditis angaria]|uniref:Galactosylgalactosylxylosylprotein 3-beta-glucuronosyltransferase n=1 Tax=Caenorhabditis angaria TaxID=860376 RepID=A0A9P1N6D9_9PELO|nr:unnamed protein product [Caenorhabditis angaria]